MVLRLITVSKICHVQILLKEERDSWSEPELLLQDSYYLGRKI